MVKKKEPWRIPDSDGTTPPRSHGEPVGQDQGAGRLGRLIVFVLGIGFLVGGLSVAFPEQSIEDPYFFRGMLVLFIFGGAAAYWSRSSIIKLVKTAGIWLFIVFGLSFFYIYSADFGTRFMAAIDPSGAVDDNGALILERARDGHFWVRMRMNGVNVRLIVDTGASNIVLSKQDAEKVGLKPSSLLYDGTARTANGDVLYARTRVNYVKIGDYSFTGVPVTVNKSKMDSSLLGMTLLKEFHTIEIKGNIMVLKR